MERTVYLSSGYRWTLDAGPGFQPGHPACASGVAPISSLALRGLRGKWCLDCGSRWSLTGPSLCSLKSRGSLGLYYPILGTILPALLCDVGHADLETAAGSTLGDPPTLCSNSQPKCTVQDPSPESGQGLVW